MNELRQGLALGFDVATLPAQLWPVFCGALIGSLAGVLPGIGSVIAIALLLPLVHALGASAALVMLAAVYYGAQYGGSAAAILVNPVDKDSADGYQMARQGRAGRALALAAFGSFFAGCVGTALVAVLAAPLARFGQGLGPPEFFSLMLLVLVGAVVLASGALIKGLAMAVLGLLLSQIGIDPGTGTERYRLGIPELANGIGFAALAIGLLVCGELVARLDRGAAPREVYRERLGWLWPARRDVRAAGPAMLRGTALGALLGVLPGSGAAHAAWAARRLEQRLAQGGGEFGRADAPGSAGAELGRGDARGVGSPESANNAAAQTAFIPLLALGIPTSAVMALLLGAMLIAGVAPGPRLATTQPALFWGLVASMWLGNAMLLALHLPIAPLWRRLLALPYRHLVPLLVLLAALGAWSLHQRAFEIWLVACAGAMGYVFHKLGCEVGPLLLGFVLGPAMEASLRRALSLAHGDWGALVTRPVTAGLLIAAGALLLSLLLPVVRRRREASFVED